MRGERRQILFDALFVPDIREDIVEDCQTGFFHRRDMQTCLSHEGEQSECLQGYGLTTGIRTCDNEQGVCLTKPDIDRYNRVLLQQWMASLPDVDDAVGVEDRSCAVCSAGEFRLGKYKVQIGQ